MSMNGRDWSWNIDGVKITHSNFLLPHPLLDEPLFGDRIAILDLSDTEKKQFKELGIDIEVTEQVYSNEEKLIMFLQSRRDELISNKDKIEIIDETLETIKTLFNI